MAAKFPHNRHEQTAVCFEAVTKKTVDFIPGADSDSVTRMKEGATFFHAKKPRCASCAFFPTRENYILIQRSLKIKLG